MRAFMRTCMALYRRLHKECLYLMVGGMSRSDTSRNNEQFTIIEERCQGGSEGFSAPWPDCCLHWIRPKFQKECQCCEAGGAKNMRSPSAEIARRGARLPSPAVVTAGYSSSRRIATPASYPASHLDEAPIPSRDGCPQ